MAEPTVESAATLESESDNSSVDHSDSDSAFGDNQTSYTQSVTSSVYNHKWENGRRYHSYSEGNYILPNDEKEQDRLDLQHHLFRLMIDGALYLAPLPTSPSAQRVLDVGCGTGIWAIEFAQEHPDAIVLGIDLSPIQPELVPPNCSFRIDDIEKDWVDKKAEQFDFIHSRAMIGGIKDWPGLFQKMYDSLAPGGILELQDLCLPCQTTDPEATKRCKVIAWGDDCYEGTKKIGLNLKAPVNWVEQLQAVGFVDIHFKWFSWPLGPWAKGKKNKLMGQYAMVDYLEAISNSIAVFTRFLGYSAEEFQVMAAHVKNEINEQKIHIYQPVCICWARKPGDKNEHKPEP